MRTVFFIPPLKKISGGLASIIELASMLAESGRNVAAVSPVDECPAIGMLGKSVRILPWGRTNTWSFLDKNDLWCIPDGWPNALVPGMRVQARTLMYVQNWVFMITSRPQGVAWSQLPLDYLSVSAPVDWFMREILGLSPLGILPPSIRPFFFSATAKNSKRIRVAWMPRKNKALAGQIQGIATACLEKDKPPPGFEFVEIHDKSLEEVAVLLQSCHIFLSTGFPEGFALPPLEAMACGCVPVGFSGIGGFEYMRNPAEAPVPGLLQPPFPLQKKAWGANGLYVSDGDVLGAGMALAWSIRQAHMQSAAWAEIVRNGRITAEFYTLERRKEALSAVWPDGASGSG